METLAAGDVSVLNISTEPWQAVSDVVMGGVSSGRMVMTDTGPRFEGCLSLDNNGGFASVRTDVNIDLASSNGVRLTVKGDRRRYQFRLRLNNDFDGVAWRREFTTDGKIQVIEMAYAEFEPVYRGRLVKNAGNLDPALISQIGFLIADGNEGDFSLNVLKVEILMQNRHKRPPGHTGIN